MFTLILAIRWNVLLAYYKPTLVVQLLPWKLVGTRRKRN